VRFLAGLAVLVAAAADGDTKMIHVKGMAPTMPSVDQFFVSNSTLDHFSLRCAKDKTISSFDLGKLPNGTTEQTIIDQCHSNPICEFVVRTATKAVQCQGFQLGDLGAAPMDKEETLLHTCGEEIGSHWQSMSNIPSMSTFFKIPVMVDMLNKPALVQKLVDEGVPEALFSSNNTGVQGTSLFSVDGPLSLLGDDGHLSNVCFGQSELERFKSQVLRAVASQPSDMKKARLGAVIVRLAGHDLMDHDILAGNGGSDGCILWRDLNAASTEHLDEDNNGIQDAWKVLKPICAQFSFSRADCIVIAAEVIITKTSKNQLHFNTVVGRKDATSCNFNRAGPPGTKSRLPAWFAGGGKLNRDSNNLLRERLGLSWSEYVALLGVHNLGGISAVNSVIPQKSMNNVEDGMARWKKNWRLAQEFDTGYYRNLIGEKWFECDKGGKVLLQCDATVHGNSGGKQFFGVWNHQKADHGPTQLGPELANKGNHIQKKPMIALSTDMAIASDIYSADGKNGEPCPGCAKRDERRAPKAQATKDYKAGDPRREATAAVKKFAKNKQAFFTEFVHAWDKVTTNGFLKNHLKPLSAFPSCAAVAPKPAPSPAPARHSHTPAPHSHSKPAPKCASHSIGKSCRSQSDCPFASKSKCFRNKCLCHKSECNFGGQCRPDPNFQGPKGGLSRTAASLNQDGELSASAHAKNSNLGVVIGSAVGGSVATLLAVAGIAVMAKKREVGSEAMSSSSMAAL